MTSPDHGERCDAFRRLHESGCFVLPNPWDRGSAILLASLGFRALATSSAAVSFVLGRPDSPTALDADDTLANVREIVQATPLPVNADFQAGYGATPEEVAANVQRCVDAGVAGLSIEDATVDTESTLFAADHALERVRAARAAIDAGDSGVLLTARCEAFLVGHERPLETAIERLVAFSDAGADCLFAPGLRTADEVHAVVEAVAPKPVNVLARDPGWMTVDALAELGVRRISVGSALARVGWRSVREAASSIAATGSFGALAAAEPFATLDRLFADGTPSERA